MPVFRTLVPTLRTERKASLRTGAPQSGTHFASLRTRSSITGRFRRQCRAACLHRPREMSGIYFPI